MALWRKTFDKQFDGYELRTSYDENGREHQHYVYTKEYYNPQISQHAFIARKIILWAFFIATGCAQAFAGTRHVYVNFQTIVTIFQSLGIIGMIISAIYIIYYTTASKKMKADTHKHCHVKLMTMALITGILFGCTFLSALVFFIIDPLTKTPLEGLCVGLYGISALFPLAVYFIEKRTIYDILPPDQF